MSRELWFSTASEHIGAGDLTLLAVDGREELSRPYEHELLFECSLEHGLDDVQWNDMLNLPCSIDPSGGGSAPIHGVLRSMTMLPYEAGRPVRYRAELVPRLWRLGLGRASRVFQNASVPAIVIAIFRMNGLKPGDDFDVSFGALSFPKLTYSVQYEESDLAYVSRLLEEHGLFYVFDQSPSAERIVLMDENKTLPKHEGSLGCGSRGDDEGLLRDVCFTRRSVQREVRLRAYRTDAAAAPAANANVDEAIGHGVVRYYGEGLEDEDGIKARAKIRAQALSVRARTMTATTSAIGLRAGQQFTLGDHPLPIANGDYYVLSMQTSVSAASRHGRHEARPLAQTFEAIPLSVPFRPELRTPRPKIEGVVHAMIDGESPGAAAPIDDDGSYRVLLPFDAVGQAGGRATRAIKRAQPSAGSSSGTHFPLHIGTEVVISHVDGDPDRPVILGAVPNVANKSPVTAADATKSRIATRSGVLIEIDDSAG